MKKTALPLILLGILFIFWATMSSKKTGRQQTYTRSEPMSGFVTINKTDWVGVSCFKPNHRINFSIVPEDTFWYVRTQRDNSRIFTGYPRNAPSGQKTFDLGTFNRIEGKLPANSKYETAEVAWEFIDENKSSCR